MNYLVLLIFLLTFFLKEPKRLIPYNKAGSWGVVDENKQVVIPFEYREIVMTGDLIIARSEGISDVFNQAGKKICTTSGQYVFPVHIKGQPGILVKQQNGMEIRYKTGEIALPAGNYDHIRAADQVLVVNKGDKYGLLDQDLKVIFPVVYKEIYVGNGIAVPFKGENSSTIINSKTLRPIACKLTVNRMAIFQSGFYMVNKLGLTGLTDTLCREIVPPRYKDISVGPDLIYALRFNNTHDVYDRKGNCLMNKPVLAYESTAHYYLLSTKGKTVFFNKKLVPVLETDYDQVKPATTSSLFYARKGDKWAVIDTTGKEIYPLRKEGYNFVSNKYAVAGKRKYYNFRRQRMPGKSQADTLTLVYKNGSATELPLKGTAFGFPVANRLAVLRGNKVGFVNLKGEEMIPFIFDYDEKYEAMHYGAVRTFSFDPVKKTAGMLLHGQEVTIDTSGNVIAAPKPDLFVAHTFSNGLQLVYTPEPQARTGIINGKGEIVRELQPGGIPVIHSNYLVLSEGNKKALFDQDLNQITGFEYDQMREPGMEGLVFVSRNGKSGYITLYGEEFFE